MAEGDSPDMFVDGDEEPMEIVVTNKDIFGNLKSFCYLSWVSCL